MPDTPDTHEPRKLRIWQQNLNRSLEGQLDLLQSLKAADYDLVMLQEPCIDFLGRTRSNLHWMVIYPRQHLVWCCASSHRYFCTRFITSENFVLFLIHLAKMLSLMRRVDWLEGLSIGAKLTELLFFSTPESAGLLYMVLMTQYLSREFVLFGSLATLIQVRSWWILIRHLCAST